jgi:RNA polymerase sigma-70 factor, ECF subfamily
MRHNLQEMNISDDNALLDGARRLDSKVLADIYDRYSPEIYSYAIRLLGDASLAEDCVSDTFSRFLFALKNSRGPVQYLRAYLYRIAHNWITDLYRRQPPPPEELDEEMEDQSPGPSIQAENTLRAHQTHRALMLLTPEQRQVIMLRYVVGMEMEEIAESLAKPLGAIKALKHRGIEALRTLLQKDEV